jgi:hypothetical protein
MAGSEQHRAQRAERERNRKMAKFRFQDLEIWQMALENLLDKLDHLCRMFTNFQKALK